MSENKKSIYSKAVPFFIATFIVIMVGTVVTTLYPLLRSDMHPKLDNLKPYTALELAGRDVYQREGCINCHTQTVRVLKADVMRYGDYSKAGEFAYEQPFLWGSRRTGPDLARVGNKYTDDWFEQHFDDPHKFAPKTNMPKYTWFKERKLKPSQIEKHMKGLGFAYTNEEIAALANKTELDAMIAYLQQLGTAVEPFNLVEFTEDDYSKYNNTMKDRPEAMQLGRSLYVSECAGCHGISGEGNIGMSLAGYGEYMDEETAYITIADGITGFMPHFINVMSRDQIAALVEYISSIPEEGGY